jgi:hypothetical protein
MTRSWIRWRVIPSAARDRSSHDRRSTSEEEHKVFRFAIRRMMRTARRCLSGEELTIEVLPQKAEGATAFPAPWSGTGRRSPVSRDRQAQRSLRPARTRVISSPSRSAKPLVGPGAGYVLYAVGRPDYAECFAGISSTADQGASSIMGGLHADLQDCTQVPPHLSRRMIGENL